MTPDEWHAWRRGGITATEVADAARGTYGGAYAVVARKLGRLEVEQTAAMQRGHDWQPVIAAAVEALTGLTVGDVEACAEAEDDARWRATLDGLLYPDVSGLFREREPVAVFECKTRGVETVPNRDRWADQVQWQLRVTGLRRALLAEAVIDDATDSIVGLQLRELEADPARQAYLETVAAELWEHFTAGTLPEPVDASALEVVKALTATADKEAPPVELEHLADDVHSLQALKLAIATAEEERARLEARIRAAVGEATKGVTGTGLEVRISAPARELTAEAEAQLLADHPQYGRPRFDRELMRADDPKLKLLDQYRTPTGARRLTIKETR